MKKMIIPLFAIAVFSYDLYAAYIIKNILTRFFSIKDAVCVKCERCMRYRGYDLYNTVIQYEIDGKKYVSMINKDRQVFPLGKPGIGVAKINIGKVKKIYVCRNDYSVICSYKDIQVLILKSVTLSLLIICGYFIYIM